MACLTKIVAGELLTPLRILVRKLKQFLLKQQSKALSCVSRTVSDDPKKEFYMSRHLDTFLWAHHHSFTWKRRCASTAEYSAIFWIQSFFNDRRMLCERLYLSCQAALSSSNYVTDIQIRIFHSPMIAWVTQAEVSESRAWAWCTWCMGCQKVILLIFAHVRPQPCILCCHCAWPTCDFCHTLSSLCTFACYTYRVDTMDGKSRRHAQKKLNCSIYFSEQCDPKNKPSQGWHPCHQQGLGESKYCLLCPQ